MLSHKAFLARLYVDAEARENLKANPRDESKKAGLSDEQCAALENLDWIGLEMAARSFARKRQLKRRPSWWPRTNYVCRVSVSCASSSNGFVSLVAISSAKSQPT
jgi:hypothetical protein